MLVYTQEIGDFEVTVCLQDNYKFFDTFLETHFKKSKMSPISQSQTPYVHFSNLDQDLLGSK